MENTLINKAKFLTHYWWQKVFVPDNENSYNNWLSEDLDKTYALLKSISDITDEEAYFVGVLFSWAEMTSNRDNIIHKGREIVDYINYHPNSHCNIQKFYELLDYFRSRGYALPWMGLSVEKLVEYGWVKLKNKES